MYVDLTLYYVVFSHNIPLRNWLIDWLIDRSLYLISDQHNCSFLNVSDGAGLYNVGETCVERLYSELVLKYGSQYEKKNNTKNYNICNTGQLDELREHSFSIL